MTVMSLSTMTATQTLSITPEDLDVTPGGDSVIVALGGAGLGIIDLRESPLTVSVLPLAPVDSTGAAGARFVRTLSNGKVFVTAAGSYLVEVDLATGVQRVRRDAGNNGYINGAALGRSLDRSVVVLDGSGNYFQRYDVSTDSFWPAQPVVRSRGRSGARLHRAACRGRAGDYYDSSLQPLERPPIRSRRAKPFPRSCRPTAMRCTK